ncbi:MAG: efflux RND transporter periplasmic adaptor subunit, partial [Thermodesulfovibrionales bacterium]|nr:efflux RND transporter periplasmic adaptor subunit [Thermodesulfovibrionales bacterium]
MRIDKSKLSAIIFGILIVAILSYILLKKSDENIEGILSLSGRIEGRETTLSPKIQGRVLKLYKEEGDKVKKGELLCEIDSEGLEARYKSASETAQSALYTLSVTEANLKRARASYEKAKNDFERYSSLFKEELVSKSEYDRVKMQYELAQADVEATSKSISQANANYKASLARLREIEADLKEAKIYSPIDGVILSRSVEVGEVVIPGAALYTIVDLNRLYVKVYVPEPEIGKLKLGLPARIYIDAYPDRYFNGK